MIKFTPSIGCNFFNHPASTIYRIIALPRLEGAINENLH
jgi:hypothetical protein